MKKIVLFPTIGLPIPAIKGGAVETLITILINQNEIEKKFKFIVINEYVEECLVFQKKYKYTKFINIKRKKTDKVFFFAYKVIRRLFKNKFNLIFLNRPNSRAFKQIKKEKEIDYIVCEGGFYRDFSKISKYFGKEKMMLHLHHEFLPTRDIERTFNSYIAISDFIAKKWHDRLEYKKVSIHVLMNCIDINGFKSTSKAINVREKYGIKNDDYVIIFVGRITPVKGVLQLINAFELAKIPNSKLMIVGSVNFGNNDTSNYEHSIYLKAADNPNIIMTGFIHNEKLSSYISSSDLMVIPSLCEEGAGLVAIEGSCLNKKIVATISGGLPEYLDETSRLIDKNKYFNSVTSDITNKMVEENNWDLFEKELAIVLSEEYKNSSNKFINTEDFASKYDSPNYYLNFAKIFGD